MIPPPKTVFAAARSRRLSGASPVAAMQETRSPGSSSHSETASAGASSSASRRRTSIAVSVGSCAIPGEREARRKTVSDRASDERPMASAASSTRRFATPVPASPSTRRAVTASARNSTAATRRASPPEPAAPASESALPSLRSIRRASSGASPIGPRRRELPESIAHARWTISRRSADGAPTAALTASRIVPALP